ncbi:probable TGL5 Triacylglycerol lipase involved in TAG mobilization [Cephalotrichum gorgonifer]|uniref:Probable TGL5 Triacylglycerol lipase involved in TAG mobilization n=1 Tax=Cephalotrichum gorgonifer TaxID=2041049 RepID=A0AAE8SRC8_9PEZI|nr:probable TGL5 Triacylglycerol lipase involved in TAG mobilization [Cephalotrichum gorgonifer]
MLVLRLLVGLWELFLYVIKYWSRKLWSWLNSSSPVELWAQSLHNAQTFEEWHEAAVHLDTLLDIDVWRNNYGSVHYDYNLINHCLDSLITYREAGDLNRMIETLRLGLVRNLANITAPKLYNHAFAGTKYLIEEYITQMAQCIHFLGTLPSPNADGSAPGGDQHTVTMPTQTKLNVVHDMRQAHGRTTLVLQGGAIFGLYHLGVVRALFLRGLLPRIITGTATGALIAALVSVHTEDELPGVLRGDGIDLSAFAGRGGDGRQGRSWGVPLMTLKRRLWRYTREGYFLDVRVLENCVRANVGDLTFEEAYNRTKRVLNITVATADDAGIPTLLNHVTAPNVLIWTAAVASNAQTAAFYGHRETTMLCKDVNGNIIPWAPATTTRFRHWTQISYSDRGSPLHRVAELFNVNHYIVSQARPYLAPFLQSDMHGPSIMEKRGRIARMTAFILRMVGIELRHRLRQLDTLGLLPAGIRRFLIDERIPGHSMLLVPEISVSDFWRLLETPTRDTLQYWIMKGERSVWPAVAALKVRCGVETELDRSYQVVRRLKAGTLRRRASMENK